MARGGSSGTRQKKHWHGIAPGAQTFTANSTAVLGFVGTGQDPATVLRMVGELFVGFGAQTLVAGDAARLAVGFGIVSQDALDVGSSAMPDPGAEPEFDWLWWYETTLSNMSVTTAEAFAQGAGYTRVLVNSKAMRRMSPRQSLACIAEYTDITGTPQILASCTARVLFGT